MTLVKWNNNGDIFNHFDSLMNRYFDNLGSFAGNEGYYSNPAVNIQENDHGYRLEAAAPGLTKNDFNISIDDDRLIISAETKSENEENREGYRRREFNYANFNRVFTLPESANSEKIAAKYEDGILSIEIPKKEEAKKLTRNIQIK